MSDKKRKGNTAVVANTEDESESASNTELPSNEELARLLAKKESLEGSLSNLERQIYALETSYLEDTYTVGNLLKGWEGYLSSRSTSGSSSHKKRFKEEDRLFSLSSATGVRNPSDESSANRPSNDRGSSNKQKKTKDRNLKKGPGRPRKKGGKGGDDDDEEDL